jgi:NAD(P)-dependent dehydrogenase (short-subunit alcohol dehydrogenase family)
MARTVAVTGSASGIGAATRAQLEQSGALVIGIDIHAAEVTADLTTARGREAAVSSVLVQSHGVLDGLVLCAGVGPHVEPHATIVSLNYFGAQLLLAGFRGALARGTQSAAVAVSSNSATLPNADGPLVAACLEGDEDAARRIALTLDGARAYAGSKLALARWVRRHAHGPDWAGAGIRLNAVAPGAVMTPLLQGGLAHPLYGPAIQNFPIPTGGFGTPEDIAAAICFLMSPEARFCCGTVLFVDGGTDAMLRSDEY